MDPVDGMVEWAAKKESENRVGDVSTSWKRLMVTKHQSKKRKLPQLNMIITFSVWLAGSIHTGSTLASPEFRTTSGSHLQRIEKSQPVPEPYCLFCGYS